MPGQPSLEVSHRAKVRVNCVEVSKGDKRKEGVAQNVESARRMRAYGVAG